MDINNLSISRAKELKEKTKEFRKFKLGQIGVIEKRYQHYLSQKQRLLKYFNATNEDWNNWHWQVKNRIMDVETLGNFIPLSKNEYSEIRQVALLNRFAINPYYLALVCEDEGPIRSLSIPSIKEILSNDGVLDPMDEEHTNPAGSITRRYPDRLIINVTNQCSMYCRHCQRRRLIDETDKQTPLNKIEDSIEYIRRNEEVRDILLTGGDALLLSNNHLEYILKELRKIPHVEIIRIGTRTPVTMPMRITDELVNMIKKYHPIYLNVHYNHFYEVTPESKQACEKLSDNGIVVGNQAVLLKGINDDPFTMTLLNQKLLEARVRPYYIFHAKDVKGTTHFIPRLEDGLKIIEFLRGNTSGLAIPTYIMNAPKGLGKVPLLPKYIHKTGKDTYTIRTWENKTFDYKEK
ncbi:Glutamate 2,3-aminomutase [Candidatus Izimaplasma bacterium HR1]|jgi:lysine 2,3-aminomutase|uniref:KamA family radical SAM protein n=1 Tax=Candidatus Izimoplasma sp. HR1 TaxID=1541959 RepID=UPI0004F5F262|nr:Glutamate 2,3-aminomutase [Candidatus Izimaplasma bacterium HR1]